MAILCTYAGTLEVEPEHAVRSEVVLGLGGTETLHSGVDDLDAVRLEVAEGFWRGLFGNVSKATCSARFTTGCYGTIHYWLLLPLLGKNTCGER